MVFTFLHTTGGAPLSILTPFVRINSTCDACASTCVLSNACAESISMNETATVRRSKVCFHSEIVLFLLIKYVRMVDTSLCSVFVLWTIRTTYRFCCSFCYRVRRYSYTRKLAPLACRRKSPKPRCRSLTWRAPKELR